ncbi:MAG: biotin--[acetyl-CoA-carboxylase] ligase [Marinobacter sp.]|uniref:biotin--[acetyl-CoA-carboxylase] ligase n=1 Tax=Marinobacter sp. TaxID=50741 RepID=UPI00299EE37B|nr:biotin--[acetyl-CoA-carboxylase] ligase [Marinobacter sp.]MDX1635855.1 biotin--[acetyl-CoA-carboxylase] ligase [Marinobacter sp.]
MTTQALIQLLADGQIHSGASLAARLGVSRTAVWKQVRRAQDKGYDIETLKGRGYRLLDRVDLLDPAGIFAGLPPDLARPVDIQVFETLDSTNAEVARQRATAASGNEAATLVCIADTQTAGRGRRGRPWQSPAGENLYLSLGLTLRGGFAALEGLSLVIGVAIADALEALGVPDVSLKWPNDLQVSGEKLAGILIELQGELEGAAQVVAGIGLNVHMQQAPGVDQAWTSLARVGEGRRWRRNQLAAALVASVLNAVDRFEREGFAPFRARWQQRDVFMDRDLVAVQGDLRGLGCGIDEAGHYRIRTDQGLQTVRAGEISMRVVS